MVSRMLTEWEVKPLKDLLNACFPDALCRLILDHAIYLLCYNNVSSTNKYFITFGHHRQSRDGAATGNSPNFAKRKS